MDDPDVGHGFFVPIVAAYIAWQRKDELRGARFATNWWGLAIVAYGSFQLMIGTFGAELFLSRTAFVITVVGSVLFLGGTQAIRILKFPLFLLFFMIPLPGIVFNQITFPLQLVASGLAESALFMIGIPVLREGNVLELPSQTLSVVEACSGIRSLLSLSFLSLVYGHFFDSRTWMMVVLLIASVPTAIVANAGRVTMTGVLSEYDPALAEGFFHSVEGWIVFLFSLAILIAVHRVIAGAYGRIRERR
jgi:exosortase